MWTAALVVVVEVVVSYKIQAIVAHTHIDISN